MDQNRLASIVGRSRAPVRGRSLRIFVLAAVLAMVGPARAATLDDPLRFLPSASPDVVGYVVHVGATPGFLATASGTMIDVGTSWQLVNGVGQIPLRAVLSGSAYVVMQAYDSEGLYSLSSNEIYVDIVAPPECAVDADCADADVCNGAEQCIAGVCTAGVDLVCGDPGQCRVGWCDSVSGCTSSPVADGTSCDDGDVGTSGDVCRVGICSGTLPPPSDPTPPPSDPTPTPDPEPQPTPPDVQDAMLFEDFESVPYGELPADWLVTDATRAIYVYKFGAEPVEGGNTVLSLPATVSGTYFAHFVGGSAELWTDYELAGRMRIDEAGGLIGATIASAHPEFPAYAALVRDETRPSFRLLVVPDDATFVCANGIDTGFVPEPGAWVEFELRAVERSDGLLLQAKVWDARDVEPDSWSVDCLAQGRALRTGRPGLIGGGKGAKHFDDIGAWPVTAVDGGAGIAAPLYVEDFEGYAPGDEPPDWQDVVMGGTGAVSEPLFLVESTENAGRALGISGASEPVTSSIAIPGATEWHDYEVTGRMSTDDSRAEYGLLINSRIHEGGGAIGFGYMAVGRRFGVDVMGAGISGQCVGSSEVRISARKGHWHRFRLRAVSEGESVRVQARLWRDGQVEPPKAWAVDCVIDQASALSAGTFGVYSKGAGSMRWDDLAVRAIGVP